MTYELMAAAAELNLEESIQLRSKLEVYRIFLKQAVQLLDKNMPVTGAAGVEYIDFLERLSKMEN